MKISARNTLVGKIVEIHEGPVFEADKVPKDALSFGTLSFGSSANV